MQGYIIKFLLFFFIAAFAASAVVAYRYWGLHESDERGLLRYQIEKLEAAPLDTDTVFLGDSSLGNAIDIGLFDKLGSTHSLGLPLTGVYGYAGSYNLLQRVFDRLHPKQVVIFQSADLLLRPTEYDGLSFTLYKSWPSYLPLKQQILALHNMLIHLTEYQQVGDTLQRWVWGSWEKFSSPTDYPVQNIKGAFELTQNAPFSLSGINRDKLLFLRQIVDLCRSHGVNCVYAHGPLHEKLVVNNSSYFSAINAILEETGLSPACPLPLAMPNSLVGDSYDHVSPDEREQATRLYAAVLSQKWASQDPDCSRMRLSTH